MPDYRGECTLAHRLEFHHHSSAPKAGHSEASKSRMCFHDSFYRFISLLNSFCHAAIGIRNLAIICLLATCVHCPGRSFLYRCRTGCSCISIAPGNYRALIVISELNPAATTSFCTTLCHRCLLSFVFAFHARRCTDTSISAVKRNRPPAIRPDHSWRYWLSCSSIVICIWRCRIIRWNTAWRPRRNSIPAVLRKSRITQTQHP